MTDRPVCKRAAAFRVYRCPSPTCGPHIFALDADDEPLVELVIGRGSLPGLIAELQAIYDDKPPRRQS
jgi:hypothetical protein